MTDYTFNTSMLGVGGAEFQVDSSMGVTGAIVEALVQSHEIVKPAHGGKFEVLNSSRTDGNYVLRLLPVLPKTWVGNQGGRITGLKVRGGLTVDLSWDNKGALKMATLSTDRDVNVYVTMGQGKLIDGASSAPEIRISNVHSSGTLVLLKAKKGQRYVVSLV